MFVVRCRLRQLIYNTKLSSFCQELFWFFVSLSLATARLVYQIISCLSTTKSDKISNNYFTYGIKNSKSLLFEDWFLILKCPVPESNQRHEDFQSSALPTELTGLMLSALSCGNRIWTYDLRVMSPASFQTAPSRDIILQKNFLPTLISKKNGQRWIRTTEASCSRFTVCPLWPLGNLPI